MNEPRDTTGTPGGVDAGSVAYWKARCTRLETDLAQARGKTEAYRRIARRMEQRSRRDQRAAADAILRAVDLRGALDELGR
jgi:hypothetical protein